MRSVKRTPYRAWGAVCVRKHHPQLLIFVIRTMDHKELLCKRYTKIPATPTPQHTTQKSSCLWQSCTALCPWSQRRFYSTLVDSLVQPYAVEPQYGFTVHYFRQTTNSRNMQHTHSCVGARFRYVLSSVALNYLKMLDMRVCCTSKAGNENFIMTIWCLSLQFKYLSTLLSSHNVREITLKQIKMLSVRTRI